jgi:hypothetical protein
MASLSSEYGLDLRMAKRLDGNREVLLPALVHWKIGHFSAVVEERDGRYFVKDPVQGGEMWIS